MSDQVNDRRAHRIESGGLILFQGIHGEILNISRTGIAFFTKCDIRVHIGQTFPFIIDFHKSDILQNETNFEITGTIHHCLYVEKEEYYSSGVSLDQINDEQQANLDHFLALLWDTHFFWEN